MRRQDWPEPLLWPKCQWKDFHYSLVELSWGEFCNVSIIFVPKAAKHVDNVKMFQKNDTWHLMRKWLKRADRIAKAAVIDGQRRIAMGRRNLKISFNGSNLPPVKVSWSCCAHQSPRFFIYACRSPPQINFNGQLIRCGILLVVSSFLAVWDFLTLTWCFCPR